MVSGFAFQVFGGAAASQAGALAVGKACGPLVCSLFACKPLNLVPLAESYIVQECYPLHDINYTQDVPQVGTSGVLKNNGPRICYNVFKWKR